MQNYSPDCLYQTVEFEYLYLLNKSLLNTYYAQALF